MLQNDSDMELEKLMMRINSETRGGNGIQENLELLSSLAAYEVAEIFECALKFGEVFYLQVLLYFRGEWRGFLIEDWQKIIEESK